MRSQWIILPILAWIACPGSPGARAEPGAGDPRAVRDACEASRLAGQSCTSERGVSPRLTGQREARAKVPEAVVPAQPGLSAPWPTMAAIVPGVLVHGSGHFALRQDETALRLLALEGVGVGMTLASGATLFLTGASRYFVAPAALTAVTGVGLFAVTLLADVYGTVAPRGGFGSPQTLVPFVETDVGYRTIYDPQFDYRHLGVVRLDARWSALRISPSAWIGLDEPTRQLRLEIAVTPIGPRPRHQARSGSRVEIESAAMHRAFDTERLAIDTVELSVAGRLDLAAWGQTLGGSFAVAGTGFGIATTSYGGDIPPDTDLLLLGKMGFGIYLGAGAGEVTVFYDHRHDGYVAGAIVPGVGSGVLGHFGTEGFYYLTPQWGVGAEARLGSAYLAGLSLRFRQR